MAVSEEKQIEIKNFSFLFESIKTIFDNIVKQMTKVVNSDWFFNDYNQQHEDKLKRYGLDYSLNEYFNDICYAIGVKSSLEALKQTLKIALKTAKLIDKDLSRYINNHTYIPTYSDYDFAYLKFVEFKNKLNNLQDNYLTTEDNLLSTEFAAIAGAFFARLYNFLSWHERNIFIPF